MLREVARDIKRAPPEETVPDTATRVLSLEGDETISLDLTVLEDLLRSSPRLRVFVETYDPTTGYYRLAIVGKLGS